jgi:type II secretory ATPase GspE/PulE/Tfp pilus assembly ATPase PilB-like protein
MAQDRGVVPLSTLAAAQVADGQTTMEEVRRVVGW